MSRERAKLTPPGGPHNYDVLPGVWGSLLTFIAVLALVSGCSLLSFPSTPTPPLDPNMDPVVAADYEALKQTGTAIGAVITTLSIRWLDHRRKAKRQRNQNGDK